MPQQPIDNCCSIHLQDMDRSMKLINEDHVKMNRCLEGPWGARALKIKLIDT